MISKEGPALYAKRMPTNSGLQSSRSPFDRRPCILDRGPTACTRVGALPARTQCDLRKRSLPVLNVQIFSPAQRPPFTAVSCVMILSGQLCEQHTAELFHCSAGSVYCHAQFDVNRIPMNRRS